MGAGLTLFWPSGLSALAHPTPHAAPPPPHTTRQCAEALGAIAHASTLGVLEAYCSDATPEVAETCSIASRGSGAQPPKFFEV